VVWDDEAVVGEEVVGLAVTGRAVVGGPVGLDVEVWSEGLEVLAVVGLEVVGVEVVGGAIPPHSFTAHA